MALAVALLIPADAPLIFGGSTAATTATVDLEFGTSMGAIAPWFVGVNNKCIWGTRARLDVNGDGTLESTSNAAFHTVRMTAAGIDIIRCDWQADNVATFYNPGYTTSTNLFDHGKHEENVHYHLEQGRYVTLLFSPTPNFAADAGNFCNTAGYIGGCPYEDNETLAQFVVTVVNNMTKNWAVGYRDVCVEWRNEPYSGGFMSSATQTQRQGYLNGEWGVVYDALKGNFSNICIVSPSYNTDQGDRLAMISGFINYTFSTGRDDYYLADHEYNTYISEDIKNAHETIRQLMLSAGYTEANRPKIWFTEWNVGNNNYLTGVSGETALQTKIISALAVCGNLGNDTSCQLYQWQECSPWDAAIGVTGEYLGTSGNCVATDYNVKYHIVQESLLNNGAATPDETETPIYDALVHWNRWHPSVTSTIYNSSSNTNRVWSFLTKHTNGTWVITLANEQVSDAVTVTINLNDINATRITNVLNGSTYTVSSNVATVTIPKETYATYYVTVDEELSDPNSACDTGFRRDYVCSPTSCYLTTNTSCTLTATDVIEFSICGGDGCV